MGLYTQVMHYTRQSAQAFTIPGGTAGWLYPPSPRGDQSVAIVTMDGVYPEKGWSINEVCTETMYILEGQMTLWCDDQQYELHEGDLFVIEPGHRYRCEGKVKSVDLITPAWDKKQNKIIL